MKIFSQVESRYTLPLFRARIQRKNSLYFAEKSTKRSWLRRPFRSSFTPAPLQVPRFAHFKNKKGSTRLPFLFGARDGTGSLRGVRKAE